MERALLSFRVERSTKAISKTISITGSASLNRRTKCTKATGSMEKNTGSINILIYLLKAMGEWCGKPTEKSTSASFLKIKETATALLSGRMERSILAVGKKEKWSDTEFSSIRTMNPKKCSMERLSPHNNNNNSNNNNNRHSNNNNHNNKHKYEECKFTLFLFNLFFSFFFFFFVTYY